MSPYLKIKCQILSLEHLIGFTICLMLVLSMIQRKSYGFICILIETINIQAGGRMDRNIHKNQRRKRNLSDSFYEYDFIKL